MSPRKPQYPESLLSPEARERIDKAMDEHDLIRARARSAIDLGDYWNTPQEEIEKKRAALEATRAVLRVEAQEYRKLGNRGREIVRELIEGWVYSNGFSHVQREMLEIEFLWRSNQEQAVSVPVPDHPTLAEMVKAFRLENGLSQSGLAEKMHAVAGAKVNAKTIQRIEHGARPGPQTLTLLAAVMKMRPSELPEN